MQYLLKCLTKLENALILLSCVCLMIMMIIIAADAFARYLFNTPLQIAYDLTEIYLLPFVVFFTISYALREDSHLRITFLEPYFPKRVNKSFLSFGYLLCGIIFLVITYKVFQSAYTAWELKEMTLGVFSWRLYIAYTGVALGSLVMVLRSLVMLAETIGSVWKEV